MGSRKSLVSAGHEPEGQWRQTLWIGIRLRAGTGLRGPELGTVATARAAGGKATWSGSSRPVLGKLTVLEATLPLETELPW